MICSVKTEGGRKLWVKDVFIKGFLVPKHVGVSKLVIGLS